MESSFGNCAKLLWPETQKILAQCPKVRNVLFLPEIFPLECSTGRVECLTDEPGVFLQIRISSEKPSKDIKLCLLPKNVSQNSSSGHADFVFDTLVENFRRKSGISSFKIRKECQTDLFFGKKPFVSMLFSGHIEWGVDNTAKNLSPTNQPFFCSLPISQKVLVTARLFHPKC